MDMLCMRFCVFIGALVLYACFGSPTPDMFGAVEVIIAAGLLFSVGFNGFVDITFSASERNKPLWFRIGRFAFFYLFIASMFQFLIYGHDTGDAVRDCIAFVFLFLPLLLHRLIAENSERVRFLFYSGIFCGFMFALRSLSLFIDAFIFQALSSDALSYLANAPTVLFCASLCLLTAWRSMVAGPTGYSAAAWVPLLLFVSLLPIIAMTLTMQRASLGFLVLAFLVVAVRGLYQRPYRAVPLSLVIVTLAVFAWPVLQEIWQALSYKTRTAGANMRVEDLIAIWGTISDTPLSLFFGIGFGGNFVSPAVGNYTVNFAHGLFSAALLKHGVIGVCVMAIYIGSLFCEIIKLPVKKLNIALSLSAPFLICVFLYASYKSLDFGLLLCLIAFSSVVESGKSGNFH